MIVCHRTCILNVWHTGSGNARLHSYWRHVKMGARGLGRAWLSGGAWNFMFCALINSFGRIDTVKLSSYFQTIKRLTRSPQTLCPHFNTASITVKSYITIQRGYIILLPNRFPREYLENRPRTKLNCMQTNIIDYVFIIKTFEF